MQSTQHSNGIKEGQTLVNEFGLPPPLMRCFEVCYYAFIIHRESAEECVARVIRPDPRNTVFVLESGGVINISFLQIAEVTSYMKDLIDFSTERNCSPLGKIKYQMRTSKFSTRLKIIRAFGD